VLLQKTDIIKNVLFLCIEGWVLMRDPDDDDTDGDDDFIHTDFRISQPKIINDIQSFASDCSGLSQHKRAPLNKFL
jgi:hypothetical protein